MSGQKTHPACIDTEVFRDSFFRWSARQMQAARWLWAWSVWSTPLWNTIISPFGPTTKTSCTCGPCTDVTQMLLDWSYTKLSDEPSNCVRSIKPLITYHECQRSWPPCSRDGPRCQKSNRSYLALALFLSHKHFTGQNRSSTTISKDWTGMWFVCLKRVRSTLQEKTGFCILVWLWQHCKVRKLRYVLSPRHNSDKASCSRDISLTYHERRHQFLPRRMRNLVAVKRKLEFSTLTWASCTQIKSPRIVTFRFSIQRRVWVGAELYVHTEEGLCWLSISTIIYEKD